jgi:putative addiction module component (TIGR02574 family)
VEDFAMQDFDSVLDSARELPPEDQARLIKALWDSMPESVDLSLHPDWEAELERRLAVLKSGSAKGTPWHQIRDAALARTGHGVVD